MRYLLLIYQDEIDHATWSQEELAAEYEAYNTFTTTTVNRGVSNGAALPPTSSATTVRMREGKLLTTDGPFAETKEQLGGYFMLTCNNLDEAIEIAAQIPGAAHGSVEIRPVMEFAM